MSHSDAIVDSESYISLMYIKKNISELTHEGHACYRLKYPNYRRTTAHSKL